MTSDLARFGDLAIWLYRLGFLLHMHGVLFLKNLASFYM